MRSRLAALIAAFALIAGLLGLTAGPASAETFGYIEGNVTDANGTGIPGLAVSLTDVAGHDVGLSTVTDPYGGFVFDGVPIGTYLVLWGAPINKFANDSVDVAGATPYDVLDGQFLFVSDSISDYIVPPAAPNWAVSLTAPDGTSLAGVCPEFFNPDNPDDGPYGGDCQDAGNGVTTGRFDVGTWLVRFRSNGVLQADTWFGTDGSRETAQPLTLTDDGDLADMGNVTMRSAGALSVVVRKPDKKTTFGEEQVCVTAFVQRTQEYAGVGCTDGRGVAVVGGLTAGSYTLWAQPVGPGRIDYVPRYLGDLKTQDSSPLLTAKVGSVVATGTITLPFSGRISGRITDKKTGKPLAGYCAVVGDFSFIGQEDGTLSFTSTSCSAADGTYLIRGLDSGTYKVTFVPAYAGVLPPVGGYGVGYYGGTSYTSAKKVTVSNGKTTAKIDIGLVPEAIVTGSVVTASGDPGYAYVYAFDAVTGRSVGAQETYPDNVYKVTGLPAGQVILRYEDFNGNIVWWDGSADGAPDRASARPVTTTVGGTVTLDPLTFG